MNGRHDRDLGSWTWHRGRDGRRLHRSRACPRSMRCGGIRGRRVEFSQAPSTLSKATEKSPLHGGLPFSGRRQRQRKEMRLRFPETWLSGGRFAESSAGFRIAFRSRCMRPGRGCVRRGSAGRPTVPRADFDPAARPHHFPRRACPMNDERRARAPAKPGPGADRPDGRVEGISSPRPPPHLRPLLHPRCARPRRRARPWRC